MANPHSVIHFDVTDGSRTVQWMAELAGGAAELKKKGWAGNSVKTGDIIAARGFAALPHVQRPTLMALAELTLPHGTKLDANAESPIWGGLPTVK